MPINPLFHFVSFESQIVKKKNNLSMEGGVCRYTCDYALAIIFTL